MRGKRAFPFRSFLSFFTFPISPSEPSDETNKRDKNHGSSDHANYIVQVNFVWEK